MSTNKPTTATENPIPDESSTDVGVVPLSPEEVLKKLDILEQVFIPHPEAKEVLEALEKLRRYGCPGSKLSRAARCLLLTGPSGTGKSTLLRRWENNFPLVETPEGDRQPVLYVELPSRCTTKALAENMLRALHLPEAMASKGTEVALMERVKHHLRHQGVEVVILDEVQHLIESRGQNGVYRAADFVKSLLNAAICPVVLAGTPEATAIFEENEQLKRRAAGQHALKAFNWEVSEDRAIFGAILTAYEKQLPLPEASNLGTDKTLAFRIHYFATGRIGRAIDFLHAATINALEKGATCLNLEVLDATAAVFPETQEFNRVNPFGNVDLSTLKAQPGPDELPSRKTRLRKGKRKLKQSDLLAA